MADERRRQRAIGVDGSGERLLARGIAAAWSPDGSRILYTSSARAWVMAADGTRRRRLSPVPAFDGDWR